MWYVEEKVYESLELDCGKWSSDGMMEDWVFGGILQVEDILTMRECTAENI